jgi:hypothetical protein
MGLETFWEYEWRPSDADEDDPWTRMPRLHADTEELDVCCGIELGVEYDMRIREVDTLGRASAWELVRGLVGEGTIPRPAAVDEVRVGPCGIDWSDPNRSVGVQGYKLRFANGDHRFFDSMEPAHPGLWPTPPFPKCFLPPGVLSVAVTAVNADGLESVPTISIVEIDDPALPNVVVVHDEATGGFSGTIQGGAVDAGVLKATIDPNQFFWPQARGADLFWHVDDERLFWKNDVELFWPQDIGDDEPFWPADDDEVFWDAKYRPLEYSFILTPQTQARDALLTVSFDVTTPGARLQYRVESALFWDPDATDFWDADDDALFWPQGVGAWRPWNGSIGGVTAQPIEFRLQLPGGHVRPEVASIEAKITAPDQFESFQKLPITAEGTRLPLSRTYAHVEIESWMIHYMVAHADAIAVKLGDTDGGKGPLIYVVNFLGAPVVGLIDIRIRGY